MATIKKNPAPARVQPQRKPVAQTLAQPEAEADDDASAEDADDTDTEELDEEQDGIGEPDSGEADEDPTAEDDAGQADDTNADDAGGEAVDDTDAEEAQGEADTGEDDLEATQQPPKVKTPASGAGKPPAQAGFAKRIGLTSTKPVKQAAMVRPYLDSPRDFGIHIEGHLVRFKKGRTAIRDDNPVFKVHALTAKQVLAALKADAYVADNGAEVVE